MARCARDGCKFSGTHFLELTGHPTGMPWFTISGYLNVPLCRDHARHVADNELEEWITEKVRGDLRKAFLEQRALPLDDETFELKPIRIERLPPETLQLLRDN